MTTDANITQSFIEMVEAYKAKPELEAEINRLKQDVDFFERNLRIEEDVSRGLREEHAKLMAELAEVKTQRDDAMFRNLELEELKDKVGGLVGQALGLFKSSSPEPTQPVTVAEPEPFTDAHPVWKPISEVQPEAKPADTSIWPAGPMDPVVVEPQPSVELPAQPSSAPKFDMYSESTYRNQPYFMKPWWVNDFEWEKFGGKPNPTEPGFNF